MSARAKAEPAEHARGGSQNLASSSVAATAAQVHPLAHVAILTALSAAALALRLHDLERESFWLDEAGRAAIAALPAFEIPLGVRVVELSPPLYHLVLAAWMQVAGQGDAAVRALSALLGALAVPLTYLLGRQLVCTRVGLLAAGLAAIAPLHVAYGREAAMYALLAALALLSTLALVGLLQHGVTRSAVAWYALATLALLYTHYYGLFVLAAHNAVVVASRWPWLGVAQPAGRPLQPGAWWAIQWALALGFAPWFPALVAQARLAASVEDWAAPSVPDALGGWLLALTVGPGAGWSVAAIALAFLPALLYGLHALRARPLALLLVAGSILVPLVLGLLAAYPLHAFRERGYIAVTWAPQVAIATGLLALVNSPRGVAPRARCAVAGLARVYAALLVGMLAWGAMAVIQEPKEDWRGAAARMALHAQPDDAIYLLHYASAVPLDRYLPPGLVRRGLPANFGWERGFGDRYWLEPADLDAPLQVDRATRRRVWSVLSHADGRGDALLLGYLDQHYRLLLSDDLLGIRLGLWERRGDP